MKEGTVRDFQAINDEYRCTRINDEGTVRDFQAINKCTDWSFASFFSLKM
jgi:hypothetical protein